MAKKDTGMHEQFMSGKRCNGKGRVLAYYTLGDAAS